MHHDSCIIRMIVEISKGKQVTIPAEFRKVLHLNVGSKIEMARRGNKLILMPAGEDLQKLFEEAKSIKPKRKLNARQMDNLVENEILRQ